MDKVAILKIDVRQVLYKKNPGLSKMIPNYLINYLRRIIHEDEMNEFFAKHSHLKNIEFVKAGLDRLGISYRAYNQQYMPKEGRNIFVSNHPLGGLDGLVFIYVLSKYFDNIKITSNDILMNVTNMDGIFLEVNKHGAQSREAAKGLDNAYASDAQLLNFPAGLCSRKVNGKIVDLQWQKSFISKAIKHKRTVVPVYIGGRNSNFFYNLANLRKKLKIKTNFEMLYLVDEMIKQKGKVIDIVFGEGYSWELFDKSLTHLEWAQWLKEKSYNLSTHISE